MVSGFNSIFQILFDQNLLTLCRILSKLPTLENNGIIKFVVDLRRLLSSVMLKHFYLKISFSPKF